MPNSRLHFLKSPPSPKVFGEDSVLIYDRVLLKASSGFAGWARKFKATYPVTAGEGLKDVRAFPLHIEKLVRLTREMSARNLTVVVAGGGSVGDFGGFVASLLKRGVRLVHVPTTWLAAIDSSHGGKTALNVAGGKNQIGTFHLGTDIYIVDSFLRSQPLSRAHEAAGELAKMALLDGRTWVRRLEQSRGKPDRLLRQYLRDAIESKYRIVRLDPREQSGLRQILNLGHTLGHVLESSMQLPHGVAVAQGTFFALNWSLQRGLLSDRVHARASTIMRDRLGLLPLTDEPRYLRDRPSHALAKRLLLQDKKRDARDEVTFVFLKDLGKPVRTTVSIASVLDEASRQGWLR